MKKVINLLIIDDDEGFRKFVRRVLSKKSWEIEEAKNGFEAGLKMMKFKPLLIILDLYMPEMDGFEVCRLIKGDSHTSDIKILVITGYGTPEIREKILKLGADEYLEKPFERQTLLQCIEELFKTAIK